MSHKEVGSASAHPIDRQCGGEVGIYPDGINAGSACSNPLFNTGNSGGLIYTPPETNKERDLRELKGQLLREMAHSFKNDIPGAAEAANWVNTAVAALFNEIEPTPIINRLQDLCQKYGCPGGFDRIVWLDHQLERLNMLTLEREEGLIDIPYWAALKIVLRNDGSRIARSGWNGKDQAVQVVTPRHDTQIKPFLAINAGDKLVPWVASQSDQVATDWYVLRDPE